MDPVCFYNAWILQTSVHSKPYEYICASYYILIHSDKCCLCDTFQQLQGEWVYVNITKTIPDSFYCKAFCSVY